MLIQEDLKGISKVQPSRIRSTVTPDISKRGKERRVPEKHDERIETIRNEIVETIKKLKELELEE